MKFAKSVDEQLIIIGNGFDLACGLKSSYKDFYYYRYGRWSKTSISKSIDNFFLELDDIFTSHELPNFNQIIYILNNRVNFWDIIFYKYEKVLEKTWTDVEKTILTYLPKFRKPERFYDDVLAQFLRGIDEELINSIKQSQPQLEVWFYLYAKLGIDYEPDAFNFEQVKNFLLQELNRFESEFADYLFVETFEIINKERIHRSDMSLSDFFPRHWEMNISQGNKYIDSSIGLKYSYNGEKYIRRAADLVFLLSFRESSIKNRFTKIKRNILSFNYTRIPEIYAYTDIEYSLRNVHGFTLGPTFSNIIFGVDLHSLRKKDENDYLEFTKTYRTLQMESNLYTDTNVISEATKVIKFFGHGLGEADYSYFLAIFDAVNLYGSQTKLFFYFSVDSREEYKSSDEKGKSLIESQEKQNYFHKVAVLIRKYASTLSKDHNENLLHKLILENRIKILEISTANLGSSSLPKLS